MMWTDTGPAKLNGPLQSVRILQQDLFAMEQELSQASQTVFHVYRLKVSAYLIQNLYNYSQYPRYSTQLVLYVRRRQCWWR